jgi:serine/threonine protein kinase
VPKLLHAASEHWNASVLKMIGTALMVLDEMDPDNFEAALGAERAAHVRATALRLNPPEDKAKLAADSAARTDAMQRAREQELSLYRLALGHELGVGAYSRVRFGKLIVKDLPQNLWPHVAVKIQDKEVLELQGYGANVCREIRVLEQTSHPAIVRFIGSFTSRQSVYIALEFLPRGDLQGILAAKGSLSVAATQFVTAEVLSGLEYLHTLDVVYGDLKPENVLLDDTYHAKLSDFGSVRIIGRGHGGVWKEDEVCRGQGAQVAKEGEGGGAEGTKIEGTADYISPEVAAGSAPPSFASDAWAFGCVVFQLLAGHVPILGEDGEEAAGNASDNLRKLRNIVQFTEESGGEKWKDGIFSSKFPSAAQPLIRRLLSRAPDLRLGAAAESGGGSGGASVGAGALWGWVKADSFYLGVDFATLPQQQPPDFSTGIVSAETASDRKWNRRKQSMMWSPMPDKYAVVSTSSIPLLPEEPHGTVSILPRAAASAASARPLVAVGEAGAAGVERGGAGFRGMGRIIEARGDKMRMEEAMDMCIEEEEVRNRLVVLSCLHAP